jgi:BlaI family transcriptional regulator, penicillinase repressor
MRNGKIIHDPSELGTLERELLELIWQRGETTADQLRESLPRPLKDSTIRTILRRLEEKGYLSHTVDLRTFVYRPTQSRQTVASRAVRRIAEWFCEGSVEDLMVGIITSDALSESELQKVSDRLMKMRKGEQS